MSKLYNNGYTNMQEPRKNLLGLGLSDSEITIYLAMIAGAKTASDLTKITKMKRPTVYYALGCLEKRGLINKPNKEGDKRFLLEPLERLNAIAEEKTLESEYLKKNINDLVSSFIIENSDEQKPDVSFYEGTAAVKSVIMSMLYCKSKQILSIVPEENFFWQVSDGFVKIFVSERKRRGIKTKNLWEERTDKKIFDEYYKNVSDVRIIPDIMKGNFKSTIFLYDDKTLYVSSMKNCSCILIKSKEHHQTMQAIFDGLWISSTSH